MQSWDNNKIISLYSVQILFLAIHFFCYEQNFYTLARSFIHYLVLSINKKLEFELFKSLPFHCKTIILQLFLWLFTSLRPKDKMSKHQINLVTLVSSLAMPSNILEHNKPLFLQWFSITSFPFLEQHYFKKS